MSLPISISDSSGLVAACITHDPRCSSRAIFRLSLGNQTVYSDVISCTQIHELAQAPGIVLSGLIQTAIATTGIASEVFSGLSLDIHAIPVTDQGYNLNQSHI